VIVVDTSTWVEFLRATGSGAHRAVARRLNERSDLAVTEAVVMEVLPGAHACRELRTLQDRAVPAIRAGAPVLHAEADFDKLARHSPLEVVSLHV
jgi:predicted nucleic acid-binding protein